MWNVLITTDTPLVFFSFFSAAVLQERARAALRPVVRGAPACCSGAAFLSKYFAVLLGLAYIVSVAAPRRAGERDWRGLAVTVACARPSPVINLTGITSTAGRT